MLIQTLVRDQTSCPFGCRAYASMTSVEASAYNTSAALNAASENPTEIHVVLSPFGFRHLTRSIARLDARYGASACGDLHHH